MQASLWDDSAETWADDVAESVVRIEAFEIGRRDEIWGGTGLIVGADPETGWAQVVTAHHVLVVDGVEEDRTRIWVFADTGQGVEHYTATMVDHDAEADIALLYICCSRGGFHPARLSTALPDDWFPAFSIGFAGQTKQARVVSSRAIDEVSGIRFDFAPLPGDSGSPIFGSGTGEVVGVMRSGIEFLGENVAGEGAPASAIATLLDGRIPGPIPTPTPTPTPLPSFSAADAAYLFEVRNILARWFETTQDDMNAFGFGLEQQDSPRRQRILAAMLAAADELKQLQPTDFCRDFYDERVSATAQLFYDYVENQQEDAMTEALVSVSELLQSIHEADDGDPCS